MIKSRPAADIDLLLELSGTQRRASLAEALRNAVDSGRLKAGTLLPSSRTLAAELGMSRTTVAEAYGLMVEEGRLTARQGSGTRVAARQASIHSVSSASPSAVRFDLRPGSPDLSNFPRAAWLRASTRAITDSPHSSFGYPDPRGHSGLRAALVDYLARVRGVRTTTDRIVICSGFTQALALLSATLKSGGAPSVGVEAYGLSEHRNIIASAGLLTPSVALDDGGARVDSLDGMSAILLTPAHQFPTGVPLSPERRQQVLDWSRLNGTLVIEDDYDGEFRFDRTPVSALQAAAPESVAYVGTASKSLAPGLSLAWLVLPAELVDRVLKVKTVTDGFTGVFEQLTLERFILSGDYDHHVRTSRLRYRRRRDQLVATLAERCPRIAVTGISAGLHVLLENPDLSATAEEELAARATDAGLAVRTLGSFLYGAAHHRHASLVIGYGTPPDHAFDRALDVLCDILA